MSLISQTAMDEGAVIQALSHRLISLQGPVQILDAIRWTDEVREQFLSRAGLVMPRVDRAWYQGRALGFDPQALQRGFSELASDVKRTLGSQHPAAAILLRMCREYRLTVDMIEQRGKPGFADLSRQLYGSTSDNIQPGEPSLAVFGRKIARALDRIEPCMQAWDPDDENTISGVEAAVILQRNLAKSMGCHGSHPTVVANDGITSDASAGADNIKLREDALFSQRELRLLEVHEGWVHVGTTLNGRAQPVCRFLSKGTPSATITQEGLAVLVEILAFASSPARQRRINNRIIAVEMAENGANFLEIYRFFVNQGFTELDSYHFSVRVFRGSTPEGAPFTKDIAYTKGFVLLYNFLRAAVNAGQLELIPLIFCGKTVLDDIGNLGQLYHQGLLQSPVFVPPQFADLHGLAAWMCYDGVLAECGSEPLQRSYATLFR